MILNIKIKILTLTFMVYVCNLTATIQAQDVKIKPTMVMGDTANSDYLKGEARRLRENAQSVKSKASELVTVYQAYMEKTKDCAGAKEEAKLALSMAKRALKNGEEGMKLADKAEKAPKMKDAKKYLAQIEAKVLSGHEYVKDSEDRKKEVEFEMKGCN